MCQSNSEEVSGDDVRNVHLNDEYNRMLRPT